MSKTNYSTNKRAKYTHLDDTERKLIEEWLREGVTQTEIAKRLRRSKSTISREIKRGQATQIKYVNGYQQEIQEYYAETGQANYLNNRQRCLSKGLAAYSSRFWRALKKANTDRLFTGKYRKYNIKTFTVLYQENHPLEKVPCFKTIYNYIHRGNFFIRPIDLPVMVTLKTRRNKHSKPKGTNKRILGRSISTRPTSVNERESFGHWEADLMEGKIGKNEPVVLTLLERLTRFGISKKLPNGKNDTIQQALLEITTENTEAFSSITFDNGSEFSQAAALEDSPELNVKVYYCHAYASWERGSNELFNRQLREFIPKGISIHEFTAEEVSESAQWVNQRIRETIDYQSSADLFGKMIL